MTLGTTLQLFHGNYGNIICRSTGVDNGVANAVAEVHMEDAIPIDGKHRSDRLRRNIAVVGDINGDGLDDLSIAAPNAGNSGDNVSAQNSVWSRNVAGDQSAEGVSYQSYTYGGAQLLLDSDLTILV